MLFSVLHERKKKKGGGVRVLLRGNKQLVQFIVMGWDWNSGLLGSKACAPSTL